MPYKPQVVVKHSWATTFTIISDNDKKCQVWLGNVFLNQTIKLANVICVTFYRDRRVNSFGKIMYRQAENFGPFCSLFWICRSTTLDVIFSSRSFQNSACHISVVVLCTLYSHSQFRKYNVLHASTLKTTTSFKVGLQPLFIKWRTVVITSEIIRLVPFFPNISEQIKTAYVQSKKSLNG